MPALNVQLAAVAGFLALVVEHAFADYGHTLPDDIRAGLPGFIVIVVAHLSDLFTGDNHDSGPTTK